MGLDSHPAMERGSPPTALRVQRCVRRTSIRGEQGKPGRELAFLGRDFLLPSSALLTALFHCGSIPDTKQEPRYQTGTQILVSQVQKCSCGSPMVFIPHELTASCDVLRIWVPCHCSEDSFSSSHSDFDLLYIFVSHSYTKDTSRPCLF